MSITVPEHLRCTCGTGSAGTVGEEVERRMSLALGIPAERIHALCDLEAEVLDEVLDLPWGSYAEGESARRMADRSGLSLNWIVDFRELRDRTCTEADAEGLCPRTSDFVPGLGKGIAAEREQKEK